MYITVGRMNDIASIVYEQLDTHSRMNFRKATGLHFVSKEFVNTRNCLLKAMPGILGAATVCPDMSEVRAGPYRIFRTAGREPCQIRFREHTEYIEPAIVPQHARSVLHDINSWSIDFCDSNVQETTLQKLLDQWDDRYTPFIKELLESRIRYYDSVPESIHWWVDPVKMKEGIQIILDQICDMEESRKCQT